MLMCDFEKIDFNCVDIFKVYFERYLKTKTSRYYMSIFALISDSYYYQIYNDCLVIIRKKNIISIYNIYIYISYYHQYIYMVTKK